MAAPCSGGTTQRQQRRRNHAEPGKAAFAEAEQDHGGNGQEIEQRIGDHGRWECWQAEQMRCDLDQSAGESGQCSGAWMLPQAGLARLAKRLDDRLRVEALWHGRLSGKMHAGDSVMDARSSRYHEVYARWQRDPQGFWGEAAADIDWFEKPKTVFDPKAGIYGRWFVGGVCNTCFNAVDRHVDAGRGDQTAIIYDSPLAGAKRTITYHRLLTETQVLGGMLRDLGVGKGDRVILYMPMVPEAVIAMLACARIGAIHSVVFGGFAARELATRIDDAKPKVILSASCGIEPGRIVAYKPLLDEAITLAAHKPDACLILQRPQARSDADRGPRPRLGGDARSCARSCALGLAIACRSLATDPLYILYTSGTTGRPKGVVRDNGGHMVALKWSMKNLYGVDPGEVWWTASDIGWVVGHSYIVYAPLLHGCTTILYEGKPVGTPDAGAFWRVISEHGAAAMFTAPTAFRAIKKEDPQGKLFAQYDLSKFRTLFLAGERADPATLEWAEELLKVPVIDHWWQTETGWAIAGNPVGLGILPIKHGSPTVAMPGYDVRVVDEACKEVPANTMGSIVVKLPLPPACLPTLWQADARMRESYLDEFPGYYKTADAGFKDEDGYLFVMGRTDDIINVAGHRLRPAAWRRCWRSIPTLPNVRCSASRTS